MPHNEKNRLRYPGKILANFSLRVTFGGHIEHCEGVAKLRTVKVGGQKKPLTLWVRGYVFGDFVYLSPGPGSIPGRAQL